MGLVVGFVGLVCLLGFLGFIVFGLVILISCANWLKENPVFLIFIPLLTGLIIGIISGSLIGLFFGLCFGIGIDVIGCITLSVLKSINLEPILKSISNWLRFNGQIISEIHQKLLKKFHDCL
jgi:hypothetical protein